MQHFCIYSVLLLLATCYFGKYIAMYVDSWYYIRKYEYIVKFGNSNVNEEVE